MSRQQLSKSQLRRQLLKHRQSLSPQVWQEKSHLLCQRLQSLPLFAKAHTILAYLSVRQEPNLQSLFGSNRRWGFSRCVGKSLVWHLWQVGNPLQIGSYGIPEPPADAPILTPLEVDLILIPAVACDSQGYRLGYGAGFYDRLLSIPAWTAIPTIGILFDFACLPQLPVEPWDRKLQAICTEYRTIIYQE
jgi:5-formyltetrahydrofolate cyclo-ligase